MIKRLLFIVFFCCGGFLFYIPYWILFGTKGARERKKQTKLLQQIAEQGRTV